MMTDQKQRQREAGVARTLSFSSQTEIQRVIQTDYTVLLLASTRNGPTLLRTPLLDARLLILVS